MMVPQPHFAKEKPPKAIWVRMLRAVLPRVLQRVQVLSTVALDGAAMVLDDEIYEGGREAGLDEEGPRHGRGKAW